MRFGIGQPVTRKEDARFLTGRGRYVADIDFVRQAHAVLVFSPHAHARIRGIDKTAAEQMPGVYAVLTGEDWAADGPGTLDPEVMAEDMGGPAGHRTKRPPLAQRRVRYVGERVAVVIAATEAEARDAAELVSVDYEVLPAVVQAADAVGADAPLLHDGAANNTSFTMRMGNESAVEAAFARALDADGKFLALRWTGSHNVGAYIEGAGAIPLLFSLKLASTVYDIPAVAVTSSLVFTNTSPTVPYRGAVRPEALYIMERLVDRAAHEMQVDPAELRKKNLILPDAHP